MSKLDDSDDFENEGESSLDFARAFLAVRRRFLPILCVTVIAAAVSAGISSMIPDRFVASSVVQIDPRHKPLLNFQSIIAELKADAATIESEVEIIRSRALARRVIESLGLQNDPEFFGFEASSGPKPSGLLEVVGVKSPSGKGITPLDGEPADSERGDSEPSGRALAQKSVVIGDDVVNAFVSRLSAWRVRTTLLIEVTFWSYDREKAARIANAITQVYLSEQLKAKRQATHLASTLLEEKAKELQARVSVAERKVAQFKIKHGMFSSEGHILSEKALARLMEQTVNARDLTALAQAKFERAQQLARSGDGGETLADVLKSHTVRLMKEKLADSTRRRAQLATRYGDLHPEMIKAQAEVRDARERLGLEVDQEVRALKNAFLQAKSREADLLGSLEKRKENEVDVRERSPVLAQFERDALTSQKLLDVLLSRSKQARESEGLQLPDARIVEPADVPLTPASPNRLKIVGFTSVGGFVLALIFVLGFEFATTGIGRPEDVEQVLELKHLSSLPRTYVGGAGGADLLLNARLVLAEPMGGFAEAIRNVWRELEVQARTRGSRMILVAGSLPGEGSSMVASNLAHHYVMTGQSVLLVDGDVRRSGLTRLLAPQRQFGLMDSLARGLPVEQAILHDKTTNLNFLPATGLVGPVQSNPEFLGTPAMAQLFERLKGQFDIIIVDAPPLLPVIDGRVLADYADQILFVMGWRSTPKALAKRALNGLAVNERKIAGVVVNQVEGEMLQGAPVFGVENHRGGLTHHRHAA